MKRYNVKVNGTVYEVDVEEVRETGEAAAGGNQGPVHTQPALASQAVQPGADVGGGEVEAPMPGTILDLKVTAGQQVEAGDVLLILEAMKMENEITAPVSGSVAAVRAAKGQSVNAGDVLVVLK